MAQATHANAFDNKGKRRNGTAMDSPGLRHDGRELTRQGLCGLGSCF